MRRGDGSATLQHREGCGIHPPIAMKPDLDAFLSLFLERREVAPGVFSVLLPEGGRRAEIAVDSRGGGLVLSAYVLRALPDDLVRNPVVRERIGAFADLLKSGRMGRNDAVGPFVEVDLGEITGSRETYIGVMEALVADLARLRGAAEGLSAGA